LITEVKLCRLPPRMGGARIEPPHSRIASQLVATSGCATTERKSFDRCVAHAGRADLGICLTRAKDIGDHTGPGDAAIGDCIADSENTDTDESGCAEGMGSPDSVASETASGNLFEPEQGLSLGPCLCTVPSLMWSCLVARQTLQIPLSLLAS